MFSLYPISLLLQQSNEDQDIMIQKSMLLSQPVRSYQKLLIGLESGCTDNKNDIDMIFSSVQSSKSQGPVSSSMS